MYVDIYLFYVFIYLFTCRLAWKPLRSFQVANHVQCAGKSSTKGG